MCQDICLEVCADMLRRVVRPVVRHVHGHVYRQVCSRGSSRALGSISTALGCVCPSMGREMCIANNRHPYATCHIRTGFSRDQKIADTKIYHYESQIACNWSKNRFGYTKYRFSWSWHFSDLEALAVDVCNMLIDLKMLVLATTK